MTKFRKTVEFIFAKDEGFSLEDRLFLSAVVVGILTSIAGSIVNFLFVTSLPAVIIPSVLSVLLLALYYLVRVKRIIKPLVVPIIVLALLCISIIWIFNGGINGSNIMPGFVVLILGLIVFPDKAKKYVFFLFVALNITVYLVQFFRPDLIVNYTSETDRWIDSLFTMVYTSYFIFLIVKFVHRQYTSERINAVESENKYRELVENSPDAIVIYLDGKIAYCNREGVRLIAAESAEDLVGRQVLPFVHADSMELVKARLLLVLNEGSILHLTEVKLIRVDGTEVDVEIKAMPISLENRMAVQLIIRDITARKQAEETLHNERLLLRTIIDNIPDSMYSKDLHCRKTMANLTEVLYSGAESEADVLGKDDYAFYPKEMAEKFMADDKAILETGQPLLDSEGHIINKNGVKRWLISSKFPLRDKDNKITGLVGIGHDITSRKSMQLALQEKETLYSNLVQRLPDGVYKSTHEGKFIEVNPALVNMLGYSSKEELLSIDIKTQLYFEPSDRESLVLQEKLEEMGIYRLKKKDGSEIWVEDHGWYNQDENGEIITHEGIMRDITERKLADEALQKSEHFLKETQVIAQLGSYSLDLVLGIWRSSEVLDSIFGIDSEADRSIEEWHSVIHPEWLEIMTGYLANEVIGKKQAFDKEYKVIRRNDQSERWVHGLGQLKFNEKDQPVTMLGTIRDITELKNAESELMKAKEKAEESDKLKSAFLANMSHEIRTPMNGILGFAELLKSPGLSGDEQQEYIRIIKKSGDRMLNIINDIIDISKIESGQASLFESETKVNEQTQFLYSFFKPEVDKKGIDFVLQNGLPDNEAVIKTDKEKLYAILTNLIKNAVKFTREGSIEIGYKLIRNEQPLYRTDAQPSAPSAVPMALEFYVKDTGYGIPVDRQQAIFDRFVQADIADSRAFQGAGLGLSISKAYVEMMGGRIRVESEEGKGSVFYFTIPYYTGSVQNLLIPQLMVNEENSQRKKLKILIVEDDETSEMLISIAVRVLSKEILKVRSGIEAIDTCRSNPDIDLILMDIKMPDMDGYEATRQIRLFNKDVFIIAQTAYGLESEKEKALESGCNEYISKPLDIALLKEIIQAHFKTDETRHANNFTH